jgi:glutathione S-transferase
LEVRAEIASETVRPGDQVPGPLRLHQFAFSHYNEKARWAIAFKGLACSRETYLPGPHAPAIRRISGQTATPVLQIGDEYISGSAAIIDRLERDFPEPALYPTAEAERRSALELQQTFDENLGPAVRTALFSALVNEGGYLCRMFGQTKSLPKRLGYRALFPIARGMIARANGVTPDNVIRSFEITERFMDRIASDLAGRAHLVGDTFTVADLTAAALLAPIAGVTHPDMKRPDPIPPGVREIIVRFEAHPTITWVGSTYADHRP